MPTVEVDPATEPFLPGTDQRDALLPDEPGSIRLRSLEHEEERYRIADKVRPASDYCEIPVRDTDSNTVTSLDEERSPLCDLLDELWCSSR